MTEGVDPEAHSLVDGDIVTWRALLGETVAAVGDPNHARWLCEVASSTDGDDFASVLEEPATERMVAHLDEMLARYRSGEPLQYVLGCWSFRHLDIAIDHRALIPRPETELVAGAAIEIAREFGPTRTVVDLGTGSGVIGLSLADELPIEGTSVWLTDASDDALDLARANLAGLGRSAQNVRIAGGSWFDALPPGLCADLIVSNPPYVADGADDLEAIVADWEPAVALFAGEDGLGAIRPIVEGAPGRLRPGGGLVLEIGAEQGDAVQTLLLDAGFVDVEVRTDLADRDRIAVARWPITILREGDLSVRRLVNRRDDYERMHRWLTTPEVLEWYEGRDRRFGLDDIVRDYGPGSDLERGRVESAIIELDDRAVGYVQLYEVGDDAAAFGLDDGAGIWSLDLFVGEPGLYGSGLGRRVVRAVARFLLHERRARDVVIMPYPENERAVRAYAAAGFVVGELVPEHELHEGVLRDGLRMHYRPSTVR